MMWVLLLNKITKIESNSQLIINYLFHRHRVLLLNKITKIESNSQHNPQCSSECRWGAFIEQNYKN